MSDHTHVFSRRAALMGLGASALALPARAQGAGLRLRAVTVDSSPLTRRGADTFARGVDFYLAGSMRRAFAGLIDAGSRGAPTLVARVETISLSAFAGGDGRRSRSGAGGGNDYLDGAGLLIAPGGAVSGTFPVLSVLEAASAGAWNAPDIDSLRMQALCDHFAWWLRRKTGA